MLQSSTGDTNPFRYSGEYLDLETKTYYLRARNYNPTTGRFLSEDPHWNVRNMIFGDNLQKINERVPDARDPLGLNTYTLVPDIHAIRQSSNLYVYCGNNPIMFFDASGRNYTRTASWAGTMWWLCAVDGPFPVGDIAYGAGIAVCAIADTVLLIGVDNIAMYISEGSNVVRQTANNISNWISGSGGSSSPGGPNNWQYNVTSKINQNSSLVKEADRLNGRVQREADNLVQSFLSGNTNPGLGTKHLTGDIFYLRGSNGARVFYRIADGTMEILGKSSKANEQKVIDLVLRTFQ